jgi:low temperature requirement protein LtrA
MTTARPRLGPMPPRDPDEGHRASTPLELFFDLTFVVAIAELTSTLHHQLIEGHAEDGLIGFPIVFFAVWWAWMNFTWFASSYDPDDVPYRIATFVQMAGVLVLAAGTPRFLADIDPTLAVLGYVIMRVGLIANWLRAAASHPEGRVTAQRYATGVFLCQVGWLVISILFEGRGWLVAAAPLAVAELAVPAWAERAARTSWHPGHIGERYGLFTIIVLGESVLAATLAFQTGLEADRPLADLLPIAAGGLLIVANLWWSYFDLPVEQVLARARGAFSEHSGNQAFIWGYGHFFVFAAAAATGVGLSVAVDQVGHHSTLTDVQAALTLTVPVAVYLLSVWALHASAKPPGPLRTYASPVAATLILATSWTPEPVLLTGAVMAGITALAVSIHRREVAGP